MKKHKSTGLIERPALVHENESGETYELLEHPELMQRMKEKAARVWYRQAELAVKQDLHIEQDLIKWN